MAKYRKKPKIIEAELFEMGMEDGYACYFLNGKFIGFFESGQALPKANRKPAIKTLTGWCEVEVGKHYIVTLENGKKYTIEKEKFEDSFEIIFEPDFFDEEF